MLSPGPGFARRLIRWYDKARRELPWRIPPGSSQPLDPYHVLLSESMLQQTQVATVIPYFHRFLERFPTLASLAAADEQDVLRLWQGLGYYSRARNLQSAARTILKEFAGQIPSTADALLTLPGVGRYTAGAVASIAFNRRVPILDGNVQRVLCRLDCITTDPRQRQTREHLWRRAEEILPASRVGDFNSALMELGAMICTPRNPQCLLCPVRAHCQAHEAGLQQQIPPAKKSQPTPIVHRQTYCIRHDDHWLIQQRPTAGRWAGLWQFLTIAAPESAAQPAVDLPMPTTPPRPLTTISHALTHRRYRFEVFVCDAKRQVEVSNGQPHRWTTLDHLHEYPLPRPHLRIADLLRQTCIPMKNW
jgi:A/G-specific adenine glycosylase